MRRKKGRRGVTLSACPGCVDAAVPHYECSDPPPPGRLRRLLLWVWRVLRRR